MAEHSLIEWTDATWNPITGCTVLSAGCKRCYAMKLAGTRLKYHWSREGLTIDTKAGPVWNGDVRFNEEWLEQPLRWSKPRDIFVNAHGDTFHEKVTDEQIDKIFAVAALCPHHRFQILTKRSERMRHYFEGHPQPRWIEPMKELAAKHPRPEIVHPTSGGVLLSTVNLALPNVWMGVSVEDNENRYRLDDLRETPAAVRWVSAEPLLGPLDLVPWLDMLDWVVLGGESDKGGGARPMHPQWARQVRDDCASTHVAFLFKQWGDWKPLEAGEGWWPAEAGTCLRLNADGTRSETGWPMQRIGKKAAGRLLDGVQHDGMPAHG